jgi:hypothetical protein
MEALAGIGAAVLALIGYPSYLLGVRTGATRPAIASWWAWFLAAVIVTGSQVGARSGWALLLAGAQTVGLGAVLALAQRRSSWRPAPADIACIAISTAGALFGLLVSSADVAVGAAIAGNLVAGLPTYRSVWIHPEHESPWLWLCCGAAGGLAMVAAPAITLADAGYGIYILIADLSIGGLALRGRSARLPEASRATPARAVVQP